MVDSAWFSHGPEKPGKWENIFQSVQSQGIFNILEKMGNFGQFLFCICPSLSAEFN